MIPDPTPEAIATARQRASHTQAQAGLSIQEFARRLLVRVAAL